MKPIIQQPNVSQQPLMLGPQQVSDEQAIQIINQLRTQGSGAIITLDKLIGEFAQVFSVVVNQKNQEIAAIKETLAKLDISKKIEEKKQ